MSRLLQITIKSLELANIVISDLNGNEKLGFLPSYGFTLISTLGDLCASDLLGKHTAIIMEMPSKKFNVGMDLSKMHEPRYFNGYITSFVSGGLTRGSYFAQGGGDEEVYVYHATMQPALYFLSLRTNCRIFQDKTVPEIIQEIIKDYPILVVDKKKLKETYRKWEYCCQYQESDLNFISRLMEQEGIYYYFEYQIDSHKMMLCDSPLSHTPREGYEDIPWLNGVKTASIEEQYIDNWTASHQVLPGRYTLNDYNFEAPSTSLEIREIREFKEKDKHVLNNFEWYDGVGEYSDEKEGKRYTKLRMEESLVNYQQISASGTVSAIQPGYTFTLKCYPEQIANQAFRDKEYLVISASYQITNNSYGSGGKQGKFYCSFNVLEAKTPYRTARTTNRPLISGLQTAFVVGPKGEEIYTDKYGRVKVKFHWDRNSEANEQSSCYIRVSQAWAGKEYGALFTPRIGHEVVVEFLEGDPDRPLITGSVYNAESIPPWFKDKNFKTRSGFKTRTYKGGENNFNELRFEDKKGEEHIYQHAEKDHILHTKNTRYETVGNQSHLTVHKDAHEEFKANFHHTVHGDDNSKVKGTASQVIGGDLQIKVGSKTAIDAGTEIHLKAGAKIVVEAGSEISLKVGGSFVSINSGGVFLSGSTVSINSGGSAGSGAGVSPIAAVLPKMAGRSKGGGVYKVKPPKHPEGYIAQAETLKLASLLATPICAQCEAAGNSILSSVTHGANGFAARPDAPSFMPSNGSIGRGCLPDVISPASLPTTNSDSFFGKAMSVAQTVQKVVSTAKSVQKLAQGMDDIDGIGDVLSFGMSAVSTGKDIRGLAAQLLPSEKEPQGEDEQD